MSEITPFAIVRGSSLISSITFLIVFSMDAINLFIAAIACLNAFSVLLIVLFIPRSTLLIVLFMPRSTHNYTTFHILFYVMQPNLDLIGKDGAFASDTSKYMFYLTTFFVDDMVLECENQQCDGNAVCV